MRNAPSGNAWQKRSTSGPAIACWKSAAAGVRSSYAQQSAAHTRTGSRSRSASTPRRCGGSTPRGSPVARTLSSNQLELARARIAAAGLEDRVTVELRDYRDLGESQYDSIASVGMVEHVGRERMAEYFACAFRALREGGLFLNHGIVQQGRDGKGYRAADDFIGRYVFPDGDLVPIDVTARAAEASGFEVRDVENLREHYARTLRAWVTSLIANQDAAVNASGASTWPGARGALP